jgi:hypothetical protein
MMLIDGVDEFMAYSLQTDSSNPSSTSAIFRARSLERQLAVCRPAPNKWLTAKLPFRHGIAM